MLINRGGLQAGQTVLIQAAGSGIGSAAVQVAKLAGAATIITTASSEKKLEHAKALGATHLINYSKENFAEKVMAITDGSGVDVVMEHIGGEVFTQSLQVHRSAAASSSRSARTPAKWCSSTSSRSSAGAAPRRLEERLGARAEQGHGPGRRGQAQAVIHKALPLAQAAEAHRVVDSRDFFGKVILLP